MSRCVSPVYAASESSSRQAAMTRIHGEMSETRESSLIASTTRVATPYSRAAAAASSAPAV